MATKSISFKHSNLTFLGKFKDASGNPTLRLMLPFLGKAFTITLTNGSMPLSYEYLKGMKVGSFKDIQTLSSDQLKDIEKEAINYIMAHGTANQKESLKTF